MNNKLEKISLKKKSKIIRNFYEEETIESISKQNLFVHQLNERFSCLLIKYEEEKKNIELELLNYNNQGHDMFISMKISELEKRRDFLISSYPTFSEYERESVPILLESNLLNMEKSLIDTSEIIKRRKDLRKKLLDILHIHYPGTINSSRYDGIEFKNECCSNETLEVSNSHETVCGFCGLVYLCRLDTDGLTDENFSYEQKQDRNIIKKPEYKRATHLVDKLNQKLVNTKLEVPNQVIESIKIQMKTQKILDLRSLKIEDIRKILKKLGYEKYYQMEYTIFYKITGIKLLEFSENLINKIQTMFTKVVNSFDKINNKGRTSMFVYDYTIHKILELLSYDEYKKHFKPPKNIEKTIEYDKIWKQICDLLVWEFIPTSVNN